MAVPYPKVNDLIDRLGAMAEAPNEFQLRSIQREAEILRNHDAHGAYIALAIIAALRGNNAESISYHEKSLKISNDLITRRLYVASLNNLQLWREALQQIDTILAQAPSPELLEIAINASLRAAQPQRATDYYQKLAKIKPDLKPTDDLVTLMQTAELLKTTGLSDQELSEMNAIAESVANDHAATIVGSHLWANVWEAPYFVVNELHITGADTVDMLFDMAERVADKNPTAFQKGGYHVTFLTASDGES